MSKQGDRQLRWLLVAGAMAVIRYARQHGTKRLWLAHLIDRRPIKVAALQDVQSNRGKEIVQVVGSLGKSLHKSISWDRGVKGAFSDAARERPRDAGDAGRPADPIEDLTEDRGADNAAGEVTGEIDAARGPAVGGRGAADEAGRRRLSEERARADEHHAEQHRSEIG